MPVSTSKKSESDEEMISLTKPRQIPQEPLLQSETIESVPSSFNYNNRTFESYQKYQLEIPQNLILCHQESKFLELVHDITKIDRRITKVIRVKKPDMLTTKGKRAIKDYMIIYENWYGVDWKGEQVPPVTDHIEGLYEEQEVSPLPFVNGRPTGKFKRSGSHEVHYLEFDKKELDRRIAETNTDQDSILYHVELMSGYRTAPKYVNSFSYDEFTTLPFDELVKLASKNQ